jgi:hypothetical protein
VLQVTTVKVAALGLLAFLALRKKTGGAAAPAISLPPVTVSPRDPLRDAVSRVGKGGFAAGKASGPAGPVVGEFWRWPSDPLPLIRPVGVEWGVYNPVARTLIAVVNKGMSQGDAYLVVSTSATALHPYNFPTR